MHLHVIIFLAYCNVIKLNLSFLLITYTKLAI